MRQAWPTQPGRSPDDQPIEEHAHGGQVPVDRGLGTPPAKVLGVGRNDHRLDPMQTRAAALAPIEELADRRVVRRPGAGVSDVRAEEVQEAPRGRLAGANDHGR